MPVIIFKKLDLPSLIIRKAKVVSSNFTIIIGTSVAIFISVFCIFHSIQLTNAVIEDVALVLSVITDRDTEVQPSSPRNPFDASSRARLVHAVREIIQL